MSDHLPRRFELVRTEDVSETSGTGVVAVGVAYPDGAVSMQWRNRENDDLDTDSNGLSVKPAPDGVAATIEVHGHEGRTHLQWVDDPPTESGEESGAMETVTETTAVDGMTQIRIDGQVFAELDDEGQLHLYPQNVPAIDLCEVADGWPGT